MAVIQVKELTGVGVVKIDDEAYESQSPAHIQSCWEACARTAKRLYWEHVRAAHGREGENHDRSSD